MTDDAKLLIADPSILLGIDEELEVHHMLRWLHTAAEAIDVLNGRVKDAWAANERATTALHTTIQQQALQLTATQTRVDVLSTAATEAARDLERWATNQHNRSARMQEIAARLRSVRA